MTTTDQGIYLRPKSDETAAILKAQDMGLSSYATISGIRAEQFGREIFTAVLKFKDLQKFLRVFPEVQRGANTRKINSIKRYVLSGLVEKDALRFFSAITVTARGHVFYDEKNNRLAIDTNMSKLSINDGQHRFYGISAAIDELKMRSSRARSADQKRSFDTQLAALEEMALPLVIFNQISEKTEAQLFFDLNNLSTKPSRNVNIRLAQTDLFSRLAREVATESPYMQHYGVEFIKQSIHSKNINTILLTSVYAMCRQLFIREIKQINQNGTFLTERNYADVKKETMSVFNLMFKALPQDFNVKDKYILQKSYGLRGVMMFIQECRDDITIDNDDIYEVISLVDWTPNLEFWGTYGARLTATGAISFPGNGEGGTTAIRRALYRELDKIHLQRKKEHGN